ESELLPLACSVDPGRLRQQARQLRNQVDPGGAADAYERQRARRRLSLGELPDGMVTLEGLLDPDSGARGRAALLRGMPPPRPGDTRTAAQRQADALVELSERGRGGGTGSLTRRSRPEILLIVEEATLAGTPGAPGAKTMGGAVEPAHVAQRQACDALITEVHTDACRQRVSAGGARRSGAPSALPAPVGAAGEGARCGAPG